jgi:hypothetical protein
VIPLFFIELDTGGLRIQFLIAGILLLKGSLYRGFSVDTYFDNDAIMHRRTMWGVQRGRRRLQASHSRNGRMAVSGVVHPHKSWPWRARVKL